MLRIKNNKSLEGLSVFRPGVIYSTATGTDITMDLLLPQTPEKDTQSRFPLVVFIQGSAWHFPDTAYELPQLAELSRAGYAVASVTHRNIDDGHPAPAYLIDVKTAIRFLRTNAAEYHIDPDRVYAFGTSSGGNTALLLGLTADMEEFRTEEYPDVSDHVDAVIDCFGPTSFDYYLQQPIEELPEENRALFYRFCGGSLDRELLRKMSPLGYVQEGKSYVPFLIAHGDQDRLVDIAQSRDLVKRLEQCGADVSFICVEGAGHEGDFWSRQIWDIFRGFLDKQAGR